MTKSRNSLMAPESTEGRCSNFLNFPVWDNKLIYFLGNGITRNLIKNSFTKKSIGVSGKLRVMKTYDDLSKDSSTDLKETLCMLNKKVIYENLKLSRVKKSSQKLRKVSLYADSKIENNYVEKEGKQHQED